MDEKLYNTAGTFGGLTNQELIKLNQSIVNAGGDKIDFTKVDENHQAVPHISLYRSVIFPYSRLTEVYQIIQTIVKQEAGPFKLNIKNIREGMFNYVLMDVDTKPLIELHQNVVSFLNDIREGQISPKYLDASYMQDEEVWRMIKWYGTTGVMDLFAPHITIGILPEEEVLSGSCRENLINSPQWDKEFVEMVAIGLFLMGPYGTCIQPLVQYPLQVEG